MKKWLPYFITGIFVLEMLMTLKGRPETGMQTREFGKLPVLLNGRIQPLDSVARNALLQIRGTQSVPLEGNGDTGNGSLWGTFEDLREKGVTRLEERNWYQFTKHPKKLTATQWLLEVMILPEHADERYTFLIHHPDLLSTMNLSGKGVENSGLHYFSFREIEDQIPKLEAETERIRTNKIEPEVQTSLEKQELKLANAIMIYRRLKNSLQPETTHDFAKEIEEYQAMMGPVRVAAQAQQAKEPYDEKLLDRFVERAESYQMMERFSYPLMVPPVDTAKSHDQWTSIGSVLFAAARGEEIHPAVNYYAAMATAYHQGEVERFNLAVEQYRGWLDNRFATEVSKGSHEFFFNRVSPFMHALMTYLVAALFGMAFWFNWSEWCRKTACYLMIVAFVVHTFGLVFRMVLEGRPPVTNLYSSAIFIGWGAVVLGLVLERFYKDGIGAVTSSLLGFVTLIIAHNLALGGDTMEMLRAVLDTNFWLATHVTCVTLGYASTFVAGFLAIMYIARGVFTKSLSEVTAKGLERMVYGIVCFATLFSFVGTVLGGIWADQSWGRFWGWDPKENGALIIVLWNVAILHAKWGGMVKQRGLMNMAVFGNIVTSFSWFGVNMLGIGLHSYGFMDAAFKWLVYFVVSQVLIIALGLLPDRNWMSFRQWKLKPPAPAPKRSPGPGGHPAPARA